MNWIREFSTTEMVFIALFLGAYIIYILRLVGIKRKLGTPIGMLWVKLLTRTIYFLLIIFALLGPAYGGETKEVKSIGKNIMIAVDLSQSMDAHDVQPSRLQKIKFELKKVISAFSSDHLGVIIFSNEAFLQCPLTYDKNHLNMMVDILNTSLVPKAGTDFGPPLKMSMEKLVDVLENPESQSSNIIIFISDGEDFGENTEEVLEEIIDNDIRLFTLGVGTKEGSKIKTKNGFKTDRNGKQVVTKLNNSSLQKIADKTDGQYFEINESENDVQRMINAINSIEGELKDVKQIDASSNKYFYLLYIALALILLDYIFTVKVVKI